ncbi:MAG: glycosyltransferase family 9 protein [Anaerolineae bacterium]
MKEWLDARNILAMRMDNLGDVVMTGPALRAVKETSPEARITLLGSTGGVAAVPLLPWIDEAVGWRSIWQDLGHLPFDPARERELIDMLAARRFDAAIIFTSFSQTPHAPGYVAYLAGIPLRAGESKEFGGRVLTTELKGAPDDMHQAERNLRLVEALGFAVRDRSLTIAIPDDARESAARLLARAGVNSRKPFILLHPGASARARRYPPDRSGQVAEMLARRGWQVLVTGVEREAPILDVVAAHAPHAHFLIAETTLPQYAALVEAAQLVICGNTLPLHLADATATPVLSLYSGTDYESQWTPRRTPHRLLRRPTACHPCYLFDCPIGQPCLDFDPTEVVAAAEALLGQEKLAYAS